MARTRLSRGGDYVAPDANVVARGLFIDAVARLVPQALNELHLIAPHLPDHDGPALTFAPETFERERPLRDWCLTFGFTAVRWAPLYRDAAGATQRVPVAHDWLLDLARQTARWLRAADDPRDPSQVIRICVTGSYQPIDPPPPPAWNIDLETERAFIGRQRGYRVAVKQLASAAKRVAARSVNPERAARDFEWLALFQVGRFEASTIREQCKTPRPSVDAIRQAMQRAAQDAGVHLRPARRGRPRDA